MKLKSDNMKKLTKKQIVKVLKNHAKWLNDDGGEVANLTEADLTRANLTDANLFGANLDFASWPLHCGSFAAKVDDRFVAQLVAHITRVVVDAPNDTTNAILLALSPYADEFCKYRKDVKPTGDTHEKESD